MRILVADDDPTYRSLLGDMLGMWDFEVVLAADGTDALTIMRSADAPQLAILDWMMPGLDGFEIAKTIRDEKPEDSPYILLITGGRNKEEVGRVLVCGADDYLIKPFEPLDLKIHLRSALRILRLQEEIRELRAAARPKPPRQPGPLAGAGPAV